MGRAKRGRKFLGGVFEAVKLFMKLCCKHFYILESCSEIIFRVA